MQFSRLSHFFRTHFWFEPVDKATRQVQASLIRDNFTHALIAWLVVVWMLTAAEFLMLHTSLLISWCLFYSLFSIAAIIDIHRFKKTDSAATPTVTFGVMAIRLWLVVGRLFGFSHSASGQ
jgi:hypothetical protein